MLPKYSVPAFWNDGKSAAEHPVMVHHREFNTELRLCDPSQINDMAPLSTWKLHDIRVIAGSMTKNKGEPVYLGEKSKAGERLILREKESVEAVRTWMREPQQTRKKQVRKRWIMATAGVWLIFLAFFLGSSAIFSFIARGIPRDWEEALGKSSRDTFITTLSYLPGTRGICAIGTADKGLQDLVARLSEAAPIKGYSFTLTVLDADLVNAFALPGGYIVLSTGLIRACESPDELAGVLAHEMAHVTERHGTARMLRYYTWTMFLKLFSGNDSMAGNLAQMLITSSFDRDDERSADLLGAARLAQAGINPMAMADFFSRLQDKESTSYSKLYGYIASHPALGERKEYIRRSLGMPRPLQSANSTLSSPDDSGTTYIPALDNNAWSRLRSLCVSPQSSPSVKPTPEPSREGTAPPPKIPAAPSHPNAQDNGDTHPGSPPTDFDLTALLRQ